MNKKALSPLIATMILIGFSLLVGFLTMSWGEDYVTNLEEQGEEEIFVISAEEIDTPLKQLQIEYLTGEIKLQEYLERNDKLKKEGKLS